MRGQLITAGLAYLLSLVASAPISMVGREASEALYGDPTTATLPYSLNSLRQKAPRSIGNLYGDPTTATLPYSLNSLRQKAAPRTIGNLYGNPKMATLPYNVNSLKQKEASAE